MKILFFRHGIAEEARVDLPDENRQLTLDGFNKTRMAVAGLSQLISRVDAILTSPKVRASQSATILGETLKGPSYTLDLLATGSVDDLRLHLAGRTESSIALIGHNPQMDLLASRLCTLNHCQPFFKIKKAGAVLLSTPDPLHVPARVHWAMGPTPTRRLSSAGRVLRPKKPSSRPKNTTGSPRPWIRPRNCPRNQTPRYLNSQASIATRRIAFRGLT